MLSNSLTNARTSGTIRPAAFFDAKYYRSLYADLTKFTDEELQIHYLNYGCAEGRLCTPYALREHFKNLIPSNFDVLEIGPFNKPYVTGAKVQYFDVLTKKGLIDRGRALGFDITGTPNIDWVSPTGDLSIIDRQFDIVVSSHCIEHQPDFVGHLIQIEKILKPEGQYFLIIPDKRYCFDHYIAPTSIADVLCSHDKKRTRHTLGSVIEHRALTTHNDSMRHWKHDHGTLDDVAGRVKTSLTEYRIAAGAYIDVHAWQFTPDSFLHIIDILFKLELIKMAPKQVFNTPYGRLEFCAILTRLR